MGCWKNIVIGVLIAYLVVDLMMAYVTKSSHPGLFGSLVASYNDTNVLMVLIIGAIVGFIAWYLSSTSTGKECLYPFDGK